MQPTNLFNSEGPSRDPPYSEAQIHRDITVAFSRQRRSLVGSELVPLRQGEAGISMKVLIDSVLKSGGRIGKQQRGES